MANGSYRFQQGAGQFFYPQHNQQSHHPRHLQQRTSSPVSSAARTGFSNDNPSPSRSPGPQSPAHNVYNMFNQNHQQQNQHGMMNGGAQHGRFGMQMNMKHFQQQGHQNQNHQQQHQDHGNTHGGNYGNHQHNISSGGISNTAPHFNTNHLQNGTPNSVHSGISKPPNEHWAEQLNLAQRARDMTVPHSHARTHPSVNKQVMAGTTNGYTKDTEKNDRNRVIMAAKELETKHVWTALDFGGQSLKVMSANLFDYTFLTKLYLNCNKLTSVPAKIGRCRHLEVLDLSLNEIRSLPAEVGMLTNLKQLLLFDNKLQELPPEIGSLYQLEMLGVEGNPLREEIFNIIVESGTTHLIKWYRENADPPTPPNERDWVVLDDTDIPPEDKFSVLNYNTLCDKYATQAQYGYTPTGALKWDSRKELILEELRARNADIMGLQEMDAESFNDYFRPSLANNDYKGVFHQKGRARTMGGQEARSVDGCATFFKNKKYILLDKSVINFAQIAINRPDMKGEHDIFNRVMPRDDVALVVFLENRMTGTRLIVVNCHIYWNPMYEDVKVVQVAILLDELGKLSEKWSKQPPCVDKKLYSFTDADNEDGDEPEEVVVPQEPAPSKHYADKTDIPMILCGDYNSGAKSPVYELIAHGSLSSSHQDLTERKYGDFTKNGMSHPFSLRSSYANIGELAFTNYTPGFIGVLDYIWYSTNSLQVTGLLGDVDKEYLKRVPGFPNYHFPSDHLALLSEFVVKGKKKVVEADFGNQQQSRDRR